ncbi:RNA polymerase sigma factor [Candidatus Gracilibacteria bacterium]|nr:RNA polymerase sigma factor [Candidatus Gracilibacteria bacterium]
MASLLALGGLSAAHAEPDDGTLDTLYRRYRRPISGYLFQLCGSADLAEELTQETFVRACAGLAKFRGESAVSTWLFRIARNAYLQSVRRPADTRIATDDLLAIPDNRHHGDPVGQFTAREQRTQIGLALAQLPEKQRSILLLRDAEDLSYAEIAAVLEISLAAVKINLFRARRHFVQPTPRLT